MSKAEERAFKEYPVFMTTLIPADDDLPLIEQDCNKFTREAYIKGYQQAEKDLLENEHEKSWRLDKKLWIGIKGIEQASYQYMYDASNDWAYDIPTWEDVQDAFKAGSEWKEGFALTWEDINRIEIIIKDVYRDYPHGIEAKQFGIEVLNRFNKQKGANT